MATRYDQFSRTRPSSSPYAKSMLSGAGVSYKSGRGYWDPERMTERYGKAQLRAAENAAGGSGRGGGGSRGGVGGGGFGGGMGLPMQPQVPMDPQDIADQALINYGSAPGMGSDYAGAQARIQGGIGGLGDFSLLQQRTNPNVGPEANMAAARQRFKKMSRLGYGRPGGLVGAAQQALFST